MAAVVVVNSHPVTIAGYEVNDSTLPNQLLTVDVTAGSLLVLTSAGWAKAPITGITEAHGMALQDGYAGQGNYSIGIQGEQDGYTGLTPGDPLYPSTAVAGGIDTTAIANATIRMRARTATCIRYSFV